jgi:hypothetical protein
MSTKGVLGIAAGVILLLIVAYYAIPNPGKKAFEAEAIAMNNVSSWRIRTEVSVNSRPLLTRVHVASCPDREHILENGLNSFGEYVRLGDEIYYRNGSMKWVKGTPGPDLFTPFPTPRPCLTNPDEPSTNLPGGAEEMRQWIESDMKEGTISKGDLQTFKGTSCREWNVTRITPQNRLGSYKVCLNETTSLPVYWRSANERFSMYFEWDPSLSIEPPDMNVSKWKFPEMP